MKKIKIIDIMKGNKNYYILIFLLLIFSCKNNYDPEIYSKIIKRNKVSKVITYELDTISSDSVEKKIISIESYNCGNYSLNESIIFDDFYIIKILYDKNEQPLKEIYLVNSYIKNIFTTSYFSKLSNDKINYKDTIKEIEYKNIYDNQGKIIKRIINLGDKKTFVYFDYKGENIIEVVKKDINNSILSKEKRYYNNGLQIKSILYDSTNSIIYSSKWKYNKKGLCVKNLQYNDSGLIFFIHYSYNDSLLLSKSIVYDADSNQINEDFYLYEYCKNNINKK